MIWNLATWSRGLPSSSAQALVGGLVGAALAEGGVDAVNWGGFQGGHPVGVFGTLISLAISPPLGALAALLMIRVVRRLARRATRRWGAPVRGGQWATAAALAFSHGANDAQKSVGVIAALLLASGRISRLAAPTWVTFVCAAALTAGTALGGWRIIRTVGRGIYRFQPIEGLASTGRVCRGHLRGFAGGGADVHLSGGDVVGRWRRRWPVALASRSLGGGPPDGPRVADHAADAPACWPLSCSSSGGG